MGRRVGEERRESKRGEERRVEEERRRERKGEEKKDVRKTSYNFQSRVRA